MVPITALINVVALPYYSYRFISSLSVNEKFIRRISLIISISSGVSLAILSMNSFIGLTVLFGIMDYQLM